jgi:sulfopyruvate decarboxylase TPP-binding subunit
MFAGEQIAALLEQLGVTHVVTVPDSTIGRWQTAIEQRAATRLVRVCREGEAWQVAAGLHLGGATPLVLIQCTGLLESGDAIRNAIHDLGLPLFAIIGYRSYLNQDTIPGDTCLIFTEPTLDAWKIDYRLITDETQVDEISAHWSACRRDNVPGAILLAEGKA